jgi:hypothetical protein
VSVPIAGVLLAIASIDRIIEILSIPGREYLKRGCKE